YAYRSHVTSGGLISYASDHVDHFRRAAGYVDRQLVAGLGGCGEFIASDFGRWSRTHGIPSGNEFPAYPRRRQWATAAKFLACGEPDTEVFDQTGFPASARGSHGEGPGAFIRGGAADWPPLGRPCILALERLKLVHLSRSSFLHSGASMCVWHHSATACSTSERVMPRGLGSISSSTLPEGGELRVGNSWQADQGAPTAIDPSGGRQRRRRRQRERRR